MGGVPPTDGTDPTFPGTQRSIAAGSAATIQAAGERAARSGEVEQLMSPGARIGAFTVERFLGRGAMGIVALARDPELDRPVAIKLISGANDEAARERLLREARAAARLQHQNVVAVHQVGTFEGQIFVVMEFVDGGTLRDWGRSRRRNYREILAVYHQAGLGLAAAHAAGLVHRDFKPDNALIDARGRVRVSDFGLVGTATQHQSAVPDATTLSDSIEKLTQTGALVGTPAYMAPEQFEGLPLDPRADQFSFCASLFEALYGTRPFRGDTIAELLNRMVKGEVAEVSGEVPQEIHEAIVRGLAFRPENRHPSMEALLRELDVRRAGRPGRASIVAAIFGTLVLVGGTAAVTTVVLWPDEEAVDEVVPQHVAGQPTACADGAKPFAEVWGGALTDKARESAVATGHAYVEAIFRTIDESFSSYDAQWTAAYEQTCAAAPPDPNGLQCLSEELDRAAGVTALLLSDEDARLDVALNALDTLPPPERCADAEAIAARERLPEDPKARELVAKHSQKLTLAAALVGAEATGRADAILIEVEGSLADHGYAPIIAEATVARGELQHANADPHSAEEYYRRAIELAAEARAYDVEVRAWRGLALSLAAQGRLGEAQSVLEPGDLAAARAGDPSGLARMQVARAHVLGSSGQVQQAADAAARSVEIFRQQPGHKMALSAAVSNLAALQAGLGQADAAKAHFEEALDLMAESLGAEHPFRARALIAFGIARMQVGDYLTAQARFEEALRLWTDAYGPDHPNIAAAYENIGDLARLKGNADVAREQWLKALEIRAKANGPDSLEVAGVQNRLGVAALNDGVLDEAIERLTMVRDVYAEAIGEDQPSVADVEFSLALAFALAGRYDRATEVLEHVLVIRKQQVGGTHPAIAVIEASLGDVDDQAEEHDRAREHYRRALRIHNDSGQPPGPLLAQILSGLASCDVALGDLDAAKQTSDEAEALLESPQIQPQLRGRIRFVAAKLRHKSGARDEATALASLARDDFVAAGPAYSRLREAVESWLRSGER